MQSAGTFVPALYRSPFQGGSALLCVSTGLESWAESYFPSGTTLWFFPIALKARRIPGGPFYADNVVSHRDGSARASNGSGKRNPEEERLIRICLTAPGTHSREGVLLNMSEMG